MKENTFKEWEMIWFLVCEPSLPVFVYVQVSTLWIVHLYFNNSAYLWGIGHWEILNKYRLKVDCIYYRYKGGMGQYLQLQYLQLWSNDSKIKIQPMLLNYVQIKILMKSQFQCWFWKEVCHIMEVSHSPLM